MEQELRRLPDGTYTGAMTDEHICGIFGCCGDWNRREVRIGALTVYVYAIDGITSGGDASEYVVKPLMQDAFGGTMDELYDRALHRTVYNSVAVPCGDLQSTAEKLVNGFTVVLFGQRAIAFETKTGEKRSPSAPEVENTVKGPKDAFTETVRTNTSLLRRHLRTPALRLYETVVGRRSLTNVTLAWIDGLTEPALVQRMQARLAEIDIDGLVTPAAVEEYLTGSRATAFPLLQYTERTDRFAQALLEGRAGLLVDGLPLGYLAPVDLGYLMTSAEDRGTDFVSASFLRVLRYAALLLGLLRQVPRCDAGMRGGKWEQGAILGREVQGRTFGIVGMGAIGRCVASIAQGFGGRVTGFDPYWPEAFAAERNIERRDLDTLLRESDFVCIHCPLTPQTENLIGTRELGLMKPSSVLVNMARGGIVDESALYDALTARHISGAVLDAFSQEPPSSMPFAALPNVLLSPHVGAFTEEALEKMSRIAVDQVFQFLDGERP